jgi:hypothetical protein
VLQSFNVLPAATTCSATGNILREQWNNVFGTAVANIPVTTTPNSTNLLTSLETQNTGGNMGARIRGYICAPLTGAYTFYIAGDDVVELWLSSSTDPASKVKIAYHTYYTGFREWNKYATQKSAAINLQAGQSYYVEVLHKNGGGGDNVSVKWDMPNGVTEMPIGASRLSPYAAQSIAEEFSAALGSGEDKTEGSDFFSKSNISVYPNPFNSVTNIRINPAATEEAVITLNDLQGRKVKQLFRGTLEMNQAKILQLSSEGLSNGIYIISVVTKTKNIIQKISLLK